MLTLSRYRKQLDKVLRWLGYTESQVDDHVRWAALNTVTILHHHNETRSRLAEAMALGRSIGQCINTIENCSWKGNLDGSLVQSRVPKIDEEW